MNVSDLLRGKASQISKIIFHHRIDRSFRCQMNVSDLLRGKASQSVK